MSYDCYMTMDTGGDEPATVCEIGNMTSNVSGMWAKALGYPITDLHGKEGSYCAVELENAVHHMGDHRNQSMYEAMNPSNGWGNAMAAERYLWKILLACVRHPKARFEVRC